MSRAGVQQRVLRAVRLLPQAIKIGIPPADAEPDELETEKQSAEPENKSAEATTESTTPEVTQKAKPESAKTESAKPVIDALEKERAEKAERAERAERVEKAKKLMAQLDAQVKALSSELSEVKAERDKLASQLETVTAERDNFEGAIDGFKTDYENKKRAIEADAAAQAKKAADEARAQAHDEGWNSGHADGLKTARFEIEKEYRDKFSGLLKSLEGIKTGLDENFASLVNLNQPRLLRLWSVMLRKMLNCKIELEPDSVNTVLQGVITQVSDKNQVIVYVAPQDIALIQAANGEVIDNNLRELLRGAHHLEFRADSNVDAGSCVVETSLGVYDARWRTQMEQIDTVLDKIFQLQSEIKPE